MNLRAKGFYIENVAEPVSKEKHLSRLNKLYLRMNSNNVSQVRNAENQHMNSIQSKNSGFFD